MFKKKAGWLDSHSYEESVTVLSELALIHASKSGPHSAPLADLITNRRWDDLLDYHLSYTHGDDPVCVYHARQALAFFEKFEPLKLTKGESKTLKAFRRFARTEVSCSAVNDRFCQYTLGTPMEYPFDAILADARRRIARILGTAPKLKDLDLAFGPGATVTTKKKESCFRVKLGVQPCCSHELAPFVAKLLAQVPSYALLHADPWRAMPAGAGVGYLDVDVRIEYGKLQFVPKDAKKYRTITVEPVLNTLFQQGIGRAVRKRLKKAGLDLDTQERNKALARLGSESDSLATIDLSSASDTIATQLVAFLLPEDWFVLMSLARTKTVTYEGLLIPLEKFSTMGNSFTFELESLIFWALSQSVLRFLDLRFTDLAVYGDDIIVPSAAYPLLELILAFCGFTVNADKSFVKGPFRESCGGDFFLGIDIRPWFCKDQLTPASLFVLHNYYMRSLEFEMAALVRERYIHPSLYLFGPDGYGDGHLIGDWQPLPDRFLKERVWDEKAEKMKWVKTPLSATGWEGHFFESFVEVSPHDLRPHHGDSLLPAFSIYRRGDREEVESNATAPLPGKLWADQRHFVVPGSVGYKKVSIYTRRQGVFA